MAFSTYKSGSLTTGTNQGTRMSDALRYLVERLTVGQSWTFLACAYSNTGVLTYAAGPTNNWDTIAKIGIDEAWCLLENDDGYNFLIHIHNYNAASACYINIGFSPTALSHSSTALPTGSDLVWVFPSPTSTSGPAFNLAANFDILLWADANSFYMMDIYQATPIASAGMYFMKLVKTEDENTVPYELGYGGTFGSSTTQYKYASGAQLYNMKHTIGVKMGSEAMSTITDCRWAVPQIIPATGGGGSNGWCQTNSICTTDLDSIALEWEIQSHGVGRILHRIGALPEIRGIVISTAEGTKNADRSRVVIGDLSFPWDGTSNATWYR